MRQYVFTYFSAESLADCPDLPNEPGCPIKVFAGTITGFRTPATVGRIFCTDCCKTSSKRMPDEEIIQSPDDLVAFAQGIGSRLVANCQTFNRHEPTGS